MKSGGWKRVATVFWNALEVVERWTERVAYLSLPLRQVRYGLLVNDLGNRNEYDKIQGTWKGLSNTFRERDTGTSVVYEWLVYIKLVWTLDFILTCILLKLRVYYVWSQTRSSVKRISSVHLNSDLPVLPWFSSGYYN